MNPTFNLIRLQMSELAQSMMSKPELEEDYAKLLSIEANVHTLNMDLEQVAKNLQQVLGRRDQYNADAAFYRIIMKTIQSDPGLMDQWTDLLMTMKLTNPDIEEELRQAANTHIKLTP
jgi:hypothetical protein